MFAEAIISRAFSLWNRRNFIRLRYLLGICCARRPNRTQPSSPALVRSAGLDRRTTREGEVPQPSAHVQRTERMIVSEPAPKRSILLLISQRTRLGLSFERSKMSLEVGGPPK